MYSVTALANAKIEQAVSLITEMITKLQQSIYISRYAIHISHRELPAVPGFVVATVGFLRARILVVLDNYD